MSGTQQLIEYNDLISEIFNTVEEFGFSKSAIVVQSLYDNDRITIATANQCMSDLNNFRSHRYNETICTKYSIS